jgi:hypothetical protein
MELSNNFKSKFTQTVSGNWTTKEDRIALGLLFVLVGCFLLFFCDGFTIFIVTGSLSSLWGIILFTKTETLTINKATGTLTSEKRWMWSSTRKEYDAKTVFLVMQPTTVRNPRGVDWKGFGLTLAYGNCEMMIARMKKELKLKEYSQEFAERLSLKLSNHIPNQNLEPIVTTPVDKVEAQSTQAHV